MVATSSDKGLLKAPSLDQFKQYLTDIGMEHRPGKGEYQVLQVKCGVSWLAVCRDARGYITTPIELRLAVNNFNAGAKPAAKSQPKVATKAREQFLEDLRDDFAMHAMPAMVAHYSANGQESICRQYDEIAREAYRVADAMLSARSQP